MTVRNGALRSSMLAQSSSAVAESRIVMAWRRWRLNVPLLLGLLLLTALLVLIVLPMFVELPDPQLARLRAEVNGKMKMPPFAPGEADHVLGTDTLGRDRLSRLIYGARYTLSFAFILTIARAVVAVPLGLVIGWYGGWLRRLNTAIVTAFGALPSLVAMLLILGIARQFAATTAQWIVIYVTTVSIFTLPRMLEHISQLAEQVSHQPHLEAGVAVGAGTGRLLRKHVLPVMAGDLAIMFAAEMAWSLLVLGQLAAFGIPIGGTAALDSGQGTPIREQEYWPEWSMMMGFSRAHLQTIPSLPLLPAAALGLTAAAFHLLSEGLRLRWLRRP